MIQISAELGAQQSWLIANLLPCRASEHPPAVQTSSQIVETWYPPLRASALSDLCSLRISETHCSGVEDLKRYLLTSLEFWLPPITKLEIAQVIFCLSELDLMLWIRTKQSCQTWAANTQNSGHGLNSFTCIYYSLHVGCMCMHTHTAYTHTVCAHAKLAVLSLLEFHKLFTCKKPKCECTFGSFNWEKGAFAATF